MASDFTVSKTMALCNNYFVDKIIKGKFTIRNSVISCTNGVPLVTDKGGSALLEINEVKGFEDVKNGQYIRIIGSTFADGIYKYPPDFPMDENFDGEVWTLRVPPLFLEICDNIENFVSSQGSVSAFSSESFGGYSYSKPTDDNGVPIGWQRVFAKELKQFKKIV